MKHIIHASGYIIYIGQNAKDNHSLIEKGLPSDIWLHHRDAPSCHVLLDKYESQEPLSHEILRWAGSHCCQAEKHKKLPKQYVVYCSFGNVVRQKAKGAVSFKDPSQCTELFIR